MSFEDVKELILENREYYERVFDAHNDGQHHDLIQRTIGMIYACNNLLANIEENEK